MNTAEMIAKGGSFTAIDPMLIQEVDTCCALTGERITRGVAENMPHSLDAGH